MPWLLLGVIGVIVFGSLYPFKLNPAFQHTDLLTALGQLGWVRGGRVDGIRNVLMYLPLGFCLLLWLRRWCNIFWSVVLACVIGAMLSLSVEVAQVYFTRVPSYMDVLLNSIGTLLGAIVGLSWGSMTNLIELPENVRSQSGDRNALMLVLLWILWRLIDASLNISLANLQMALHPLLHIEISWLLVLRYLLLWLVVSLAVLSFASRQRGNEALLAVIGIVVVGRILFVSPAFESSELLALLLLLPALVVVHALRWIPANVVILIALFSLYVCDHVLPLNMVSFHGGFDVIPFVSWSRQEFPVNGNVVMHIVFVIAALIWLLKETGVSIRWSAIAIVSVLLGFEILHMWQDGRSGSITRPALALVIGALMSVIDRSGAAKKTAVAV